MEYGLKLSGEHNGVFSEELYVNPAYLAINITSPSKKIIVPGVNAIEAVEPKYDDDGKLLTVGVEAVEAVEEEFVLEYPCILNAYIHVNQDTEMTIEGKGTSLNGAVATQEEVEAIAKIMQNIASRTEKLEGAVKL